MIEALLRAEGLARRRLRLAARARLGASGSRSTARRPTSSGARRACAPHAEAVGATQFEVLTAAALAEFAAARGRRRGRRGGARRPPRRDERARARVVVLTNVALEHTDVLGETREAIAREKLAVVRPGAGRARRAGVGGGSRAGRRGRVTSSSRVEQPRARASRPPRRSSADRSIRRRRARAACPGGSSAAARRRSRSGTARTTSPASATCSRAAAARRRVDRRLDPRGQGRRRRCSPRSRPSATRSSRRARRTRARFPPRARRARAGRYFDAGRGRRRPAAALARARELAADGAVLVTGSLYLLADLAASPRHVPWRALGERLSVFAFAASCSSRSWRLRSAPASSSGRSCSDGDTRCSSPRRRPRPRTTISSGRLATSSTRTSGSSSATSRSSSSSSSGSRPPTGSTRTRGAGSRIRWLIAVAVALGIFPPFLGPLIYMLFRPPEYLEDVRERELEIRAMEEPLGTGSDCPVCRAAVDAHVPRLPGLHDALRQACRHCRQPLEPVWQVCPYCETPVEHARARARSQPCERAAGTRRAASQRRRRGRLRAAWPSSSTLVLIKPDAVAARPGGRDPRPLRAARPRRSARRSSSRVDRDLAERHYAEHAREAVLRRARRLHHLGADARARARGRGRDRRRPDDDGRDQPGRTPLRARSEATSRSRCRTTSSTGPTRPSRRSARSRSGSPPMSSCEGRRCPAHRPSATTSPQPRELGRDARNWVDAGRRNWASEEPHVGDVARARGGARASFAEVARQGRDRARLRHGVLVCLARAPRCAAGRDRQLRAPARDRPGASSASTASSSRSFTRMRRRCRSRTRASTSRSPSTARASGATRTPGSREAARLLRPGGSFVFSGQLGARHASARPTSATSANGSSATSSGSSASSGLRRSVNFHLRHGQLIRLRETGSRSSGWSSYRRPGRRRRPRFWIGAEWAKRWPCEEIWVAPQGGMIRLLLASTSPQRRAILEQLGIPSTSSRRSYEEHDPRRDRRPTLVSAHALGKARSVADVAAGRPVLGVDTEVVADGDVSASRLARRGATMLRALAGRRTTSSRASASRGDGSRRSTHDTTRVAFRPLSQREIAAYLATGEWEGRAGALRDPGTRRRARRADRGRLPERGRPPRRVARAAPRTALPGRLRLRLARNCRARANHTPLHSMGRTSWVSRSFLERSAAATWPSTSAPRTRSSTSAAAGSCSPSRPSSRSTSARARCTPSGSRPSGCSAGRRARSRPSAR